VTTPEQKRLIEEILKRDEDVRKAREETARKAREELAKRRSGEKK
jgi:hypothetical protein